MDGPLIKFLTILNVDPSSPDCPPNPNSPSVPHFPFCSHFDLTLPVQHFMNEVDYVY